MKFEPRDALNLILLTVAVACLSVPGDALGQSLSVADLTGEQVGDDPPDAPATIEDLANTLVGSGISVVPGSAQIVQGDPRAFGLFRGGDGIIGSVDEGDFIDEGVILSSGRVIDVIGPNESDGSTTAFESIGDAQLNAVLAYVWEHVLGWTSQPPFTMDAAVFEFDFEVQPPLDEVTVRFVFGSEEYNESVGTNFSDLMAIWVWPEGEMLDPVSMNCAVIDVNGESVPVSINTINNGQPDVPPRNPEYFINNDPFSPDSEGGVVDPEDLLNTEMNGLTVVLTCEASVAPGINHIRVAIADAQDDYMDSWVLLEAGSIWGRVPECGDGILDAGEECDHGPFNGLGCCTTECRFADVGSLCGPEGSLSRCVESGGDEPVVCECFDVECIPGDLEGTCDVVDWDDGAACGAGNGEVEPLYCTPAASCTAGLCLGDADHGLCDDGLICTENMCIQEPEIDACTVDLVPGYCLVSDGGGPCFLDGQVDPDNECLFCDADTDPWSLTPQVGAPCDDGVACTVAACSSDGDCPVGVPDDGLCDDGLSCTSNSCDVGAGGCVTVVTEGCLIEGMCVPEGAADPDNECMACDSGVDAHGYSPVAAGTVCTSDGLFCTGVEACVEGECVSPGDPCDEETEVCAEDLDLCLDRVPVSIVAPEDGSTIDEPRPLIEGTATAYASVEIFANDVLIGAVEADEEGEWSFLADQDFDDGEIEIRAVATVGEFVSDDEITVVVAAEPVDDCADPALNDCHETAICVNLPEGYECICADGQEMDAEGACVDVDPCAAGTHSCDENALCSPTADGYSCECLEGFEGDGFDCTPVTDPDDEDSHSVDQGVSEDSPRGCGSCSSSGSAPDGGLLAMVALLGLLWRRSRKSLS